MEKNRDDSPFVVTVCPGSSLEEIRDKLNGRSEWEWPHMQFVVTDNFNAYIHHAQGHDEMFRDLGIYESDTMFCGQLVITEGQVTNLRIRGTMSVEEKNRRIFVSQIEDSIKQFLSPLWEGQSHLLNVVPSTELPY